MSQATLARKVHVHPDTIAKVEKAVRWPTEELVESCTVALDADDTLATLWPEVARQRDEGRLSALAENAEGVEQHAVGLETFGDIAYRLWKLGKAGREAALSVLEAGIADISEQYEVKDPALLAPSVVALRQALEPMVHAQVSTRQKHMIFTFAGRASALLSYMSVNLGRFGYADAYAAEAFVLAGMAGDRGLTAWIRGTQSFASYYRRDYQQAVEYARDGLRLAENGPQALRLRVNCEARALAFQPRRRREAEDSLSAAYKLADHLDVKDGISPCISFGPYSRGRVIANAITVLQTLGATDQAADLVRDIEKTIEGSNSTWSRSLIDLDRATMLLKSSDPDVEQAMHLACAALATSAERPITSIVQRSHTVARSVAGFSNLPSVREFLERLRLTAVASDRRRDSEPTRT